MAKTINLIPRVLLVDDTWFHRETLNNFLSGSGFEIIAEAENGLEGIELFDKHKPDLVTMDVNMPYMDGIKAVRKIISRHPDALIIMVTGMGDPHTIKEARLAGASDFIVKPFKEPVLMRKIEKLLAPSFPDFFNVQE